MTIAVEASEENDAERIEVYLDDGEEPIAAYRTPARVRFDTNELADGTHQLRVRAIGSSGTEGVRTVEFDVRNGPAIDIEGLAEGDVVSGDVSLMVHAWGGAGEEDWEASRAESPTYSPPATERPDDSGE